MSGNLTKSQALKLLRGAIKQADGYGHSLEFGRGLRHRFDPETGEPVVISDDQAFLRCHNSKMRAIWDVWEKLPQIVAALSALEDSPAGLADAHKKDRP